MTKSRREKRVSVRQDRRHSRKCRHLDYLVRSRGCSRGGSWSQVATPRRVVPQFDREVVVVVLKTEVMGVHSQKSLCRGGCSHERDSNRLALFWPDQVRRRDLSLDRPLTTMAHTLGSVLDIGGLRLTVVTTFSESFAPWCHPKEELDPGGEERGPS